jgi:hypothetical protein
MIAFVLYLIAFVCFVAAAIGLSSSRINLVAAGLAAWVLVALISAIP